MVNRHEFNAIVFHTVKVKFSLASTQFCPLWGAKQYSDKDTYMANKLDKEQSVTVEEVIVSQSYEIAALVTLLERKGILTRKEIIAEIKRLHKSK